MKKTTLLMMFVSTLWGYAQVRNYTFSQTTGTYTEITDGTSLGNTASDNQYFVDPDPAKSLGSVSTTAGLGFPIGFNFTYNGSTFDRFAVVTDGWISLGSSTRNPNAVVAYSKSITSPLNYEPAFASNPDILATISPLAMDLIAQSGSSILFQTTGTAPNRILVVQWKNYRKKTNGSGDSYNFQVKLYETSNVIEFAYGTMFNNTISSSCQVGLRAEPSVFGYNFVNRTSTIGWDAASSGKTDADSMPMTNSIKPPMNLVYTWTPGTGCGTEKGLTIASPTATSTTLSWGHYNPAPSVYEYFISTSKDLPTGSGTSTTASSASLTSLIPNTFYYVFMRSSCGTDFSQWALEGTFRTTCPDSFSSFTENFDSFDPATATVSVPYCWKKGGSGSTSLNYFGVSAPTALKMTAYGVSQVSYVRMPKINNLQAESNRLRFKAYIEEAGGTLDVGYYTDNADNTNLNTFVLLKTINLPSPNASSATEFIIYPKQIPAGVSYLGFRNQGIAANYQSVHIDDLVWEPIPPCADIKSLTTKGVFSTSAKISWTPGDTETAWQYVYGSVVLGDPKNPNPITLDPTKLTPVDVTSSTATIDGLTAVTSYAVWVRSKCNDASFGSWIGPLVFTTTCNPTTEFIQNFDASGSFPSCWAKVGSNGSAAPLAVSDAPSGSRVLNMVGTSLADKSIVMMQPVSNAGAGTHRLKFKLRGAEAGATVEVGYLTNAVDENSFVVVQSYAATSASTYDNIVTKLGTAPTTPNLAFRIPGYPSSTVYIDDVIWEPIPACPEVSNIKVTSFTGDSVGMAWTASGTENYWQYAVGPASTTNPYTLTASDFTSPFSYGLDAIGTVLGLQSATNYKIWVRSKCSSSSFGAWVGPISFTTACAPVNEFIQNFDSNTALPSCWSKVGSAGNILVIPLSAPTAPNVLSIYSLNKDSRGVVAMPPVTNADMGDHRLRFKFRSNVVNAVVEVGYLMNILDPNSFNMVKTFTSTSTTDFINAIADLGTAPESQFLAFRNAGTVSSASIYIDDVVWEPISACADVSGLRANMVSSTSLDIDWKAWGTETAWQYVLGASTVVDPTTLTPVTVQSKAITINNLTPATSYKIWVRAKCNSTPLGGWIGPLHFATNCPPVSEFTQNFDSDNNFPSCWGKIGTSGTVSVTPFDAPSSPDVASIYSGSDSSLGILALQPVNNAATGDHRLKFKMRGSSAGAQIEFGYLTNLADPKTFTVVETFSVSTMNLFEIKTSKPTYNPGIQVFALRNPSLLGGSTVYVDDLVWEQVPAGEALGVDNFESNSFTYYPNPVKDILNLSFDQEITNVAIFNLLGQQVINQFSNGNKVKIDMTNLCKGAYLVKVTAGGQSKTIKIVKE